MKDAFKNAKPLIITGGIAWLLGTAGLLIYMRTQSTNTDSLCATASALCDRASYRHTPNPTYKSATSYTTTEGVAYECTQEIRVVSFTLDANDQYVDFYPIDPNEAEKRCKEIK